MFGLKMPQSIFVQGDGFLRAGTPKSDPPHPYDMTALATNCGFACELYLKCLIHLKTGQLVKNQHNLSKLFAMLPKEIQSTIEQRFNDVMAKQNGYDFSSASEEDKKVVQAVIQSLPKNFAEALKIGGDAFIEWRYLYENESGTSNPFSLFPLPSILRAVILDHKPEWGNFSIKMTKIGNVA